MKVGVIIISWNSKEYVAACLKGLLTQEQAPVYVVDNGSHDGSADYIEANYPTITLVRSPVNLGFSLANNLGMKKAVDDGCEAVFLLNSDTIIDEPFLKFCVDVMEVDRAIGIVGPVVVECNPPNRIQSRGGIINTWLLLFPYVGSGEIYHRSGRCDNVDYTLGAAMLIRSEVILKTGGFDPEFYPAYVEEADLCYRARQAGYKCIVTHSARVRHIGEVSSGGKSNSFRRFIANSFLFALKHLGPMQCAIALPVLVMRVMVNKIRSAF